MSDPKQPGEGNREADRRYRKHVRDTVESGDVEEKAREAEPDSESEAKRIRKAEKKGKEKAQEKDPAVKRDYTSPKG